MSEIKLTAVLSKTTTDRIKSKLLSPSLAEMTFDVYLTTPMQYSQMVEELYEEEFEIIIRKK